MKVSCGKLRALKVYVSAALEASGLTEFTHSVSGEETQIEIIAKIINRPKCAYDLIRSLLKIVYPTR